MTTTKELNDHRHDSLQAVFDLGLLNDETDDLSAMLIEGHVAHDSVVWQRKVQHAQNGSIPLGAMVLVLKAMTPDERAALADRVRARCPYCAPKSA